MALPTFPNSPAFGELHTTNGVTWRYRTDGRWEPLGFNAQNYYVTPEMFGAVGDGVTNDTSAVQSCLSVQGKTKMFRPGATYLVQDRLNITGQQDTAVYGNGARILRNQTDGMYPGQPANANTGYASTGADWHILVILNSKNILIDGLRIRGGYNPASPQTPGINTSYWSNSQTNGRGEDGHGISIVQSEDVICRNNEVVNVWGDAFWVASGGYLGDPSHTPNRNIVICDNDIRNPFRGALSSVHHLRLTFERNYVEKYTGYTTAVLLEPNYNVAQNCEYTSVKNNTISAGLSGIFACTSGAALLDGRFVQHIEIVGNTMAGSAGIALTSPGTSGVLIEGNTYSNSGLVANSAQYGLFLEAFSSNNIKCIGNTDRTGGTSVDYYRGVRLDQCNDVTFEKHTINPLYDKSNVEYFQVLSTNSFRLLDSYIKGRDTTDPNGTPLVSMFGTSSNCTVRGNRFDGTGLSSQGVVYLEQASYTGVNNTFEDNIITASSGVNAVALKTNHFGTAVGKNTYTSGRVSNVSGGAPQCYQHPTALDARIVYTYGTAAPTTGTGAAGSRVYNLGAGPTDYWECTAAGSPGTWTARN
jgi:hypothetical protein